MSMLWACDERSDRPGPTDQGAAAAGSSGSLASNPFENADRDAAAPPVAGEDGGVSGGSACGLAGCGRSLGSDESRLDLLFVVDDSGSMREEQAALVQEFPRMMRKLTSGDHDEDGEAEYTPVSDLHLGVVSTNMGSLNDIPGCTGKGDDGRLLSRGGGAECTATYPAFLSYQAEAGGDPEATARDFGCLASLGTDGCGFEQPLEAALKALWPSGDPQLEFLGTTVDETSGRGDRDNQGFLRNDPWGEPATLGIIIVSDENDCSAHDSRLWTPQHFLAADDPLAAQELNLRCFHNPDLLYPIERYLHGYRGLHGLTQARVLFGAIVGVPVDLVDQVALAQVDWDDDAQREAHYQKILDDERMVERVDETASPDLGGSLVPSCTSEHGQAYPPRRIVELARQFGPNSLVQSICGDNLGPPIDIIVRRIARRPD